MEGAALSPHVNIILGDFSIHIDSQIAESIISTQFCHILILSNMCQNLHTYMDISLMYSALVNPSLPQFVIM